MEEIMNNNLVPLTPLVPLSQGSYAPQVDPLSVLAGEKPDLAYDIMKREQALRERSTCDGRYAAELGAMTSISRDQTDQICGWLENRQPHEKCATANYDASVEEGGFFFGSSKRIKVRSSFSIS